MGVVAFNTYEFIKSLTDAGIDEEPAAAISAGILRAHEVANLATKNDVDSVVLILRGEMAELRGEMKADIQELRGEMAKLRAEMKADIQELRGEMAELRSETKADWRELELRMTIKLSSMMIVAVGVIGMMIKFL